MMANFVAVHFFKGKIFVHTHSLATTGIWIGTENVDVVSNVPFQELGTLVRRMLSKSVSGVPHTTDYKKPTEALLKLANVKNWCTFGNNSDSCSIAEENGCFEIIPERKYRKQGAKTGILNAKRTLNNPSDEELGQATQEALEISAEAEAQL